MKPASCLDEGLAVKCATCGLVKSPRNHAIDVLGPVEDWLAGVSRFGPSDWQTTALRMARRKGQYADVTIFDDERLLGEIEVLSARLHHYRAAGVVAPREVA